MLHQHERHTFEIDLRNDRLDFAPHGQFVANFVNQVGHIISGTRTVHAVQEDDLSHAGAAHARRRDEIDIIEPLQGLLDLPRNLLFHLVRLCTGIDHLTRITAVLIAGVLCTGMLIAAISASSMTISAPTSTIRGRSMAL